MKRRRGLVPLDNAEGGVKDSAELVFCQTDLGFRNIVSGAYTPEIAKRSQAF